MNLPNRITMSRIILSIIVLIILIMPFNKIGFDLPDIVVTATLRINVKYIICGILFAIASITDLLDGYVARRYNLVTDFGKVMDAIADKLLVNGVLIILSTQGFINVIIPTIIVCRDIIVDSIKMVAGKKNGAVAASRTGKFKTVFMMTGLTLMLFYNLPFEIWGIRIADALIMIATVLSIVSGIEYYIKNKEIIMQN